MYPNHFLTSVQKLWPFTFLSFGLKIDTKEYLNQYNVGSFIGPFHAMNKTFVCTVLFPTSVLVVERIKSYHFNEDYVFMKVIPSKMSFKSVSS